MIIFEQKKWGTIVTIVLLFLSIIQLVHYHPILPDRIASHFNLMMQPDKWSAKNTVMFFNLALILFFALLFHFLSWLIYKMPESFINLPDKSYWLAPERKKHTLNSLAAFFIWMGNVTIVFLIVTFNLVYQANSSPDQKTHNFWLALFLFLFTIGFMIYHGFKRFQKKPIRI